jgi:biopolymer transport protein ExbB
LLLANNEIIFTFVGNICFKTSMFPTILQVETTIDTAINAAANAAMAQNAVPQAVEESYSLIDMCLKGGWLMAVLGLLSMVAIYIFGQRMWMLVRAGKTGEHFMKDISDKLSDNKFRSACDLCDRTDTPLSRTIKKGIEKINLSDAEVKAAMESTANREVAKLEKGLSTLASISGGAPMIGFLGTVTGMIKAFFNMANAGNNVDISLLSSGIYEAMVTTVGGLIVGIVAYFAYNFLNSRIDSVTNNLNEGIDEFMDLLQQEGEE